MNVLFALEETAGPVEWAKIRRAPDLDQAADVLPFVKGILRDLGQTHHAVADELLESCLNRARTSP